MCLDRKVAEEKIKMFDDELEAKRFFQVMLSLFKLDRLEVASTESLLLTGELSWDQFMIQRLGFHLGKVDFVLSGIPLGALPGERALALIDAIRRVINPGGMYIQFQYSLLDRKRVRSRFTILRTVPVLLNIPPAVVYYAQR